MKPRSIEQLERRVPRRRPMPYTARDEKLITEMMGVAGFITYDPDHVIVLVSGAKTHVYVRGRSETTDHPGFMHQIGRKIEDVVWQESCSVRQPCIIGVPDAATPLAVATSTASFTGRCGRLGSTIACRIMHKSPKAHGADEKRWVDGTPNHQAHEYFLLENVITTGGTVIDAAKHLLDDGYCLEDVTCLVFVDREQGGIETIERGVPWTNEKDQEELRTFRRVVAIYRLTKLVSAFGEMNLWPPEHVAAVHQEIHATTVR
ncbi:hypothetical protein HYZ80_00595 [Candidatus Parcubacteria bacterium]|nr:hypothetical protein [Candidatus Parcubacteria bacterium]